MGCSGPKCDREAKTRGLCVAHYSQWQKRGKDLSELTPIGCPERKARLAREHWEARSEEDRQRLMAPFVAAAKRPRDPEWTRRAAESLRARWARGEVEQVQRTCRGCEQTFMPNSGHHFWCTKQCFNTKKRCDARGITMKQYLQMMRDQDSRCALCGKEWHGFNKSKSLVIDHCHETGRVRGLLCGDCNTALGRFGDSSVRLRAAIVYLERAS